MTTIDHNDLPANPPAATGLLAALWRAMVRNRLWHTQRVTLEQLSHYDARRLRDLGIDPHDVAEALHHRRPSILFDPLSRRG